MTIRFLVPLFALALVAGCTGGSGSGSGGPAAVQPTSPALSSTVHSTPHAGPPVLVNGTGSFVAVRTGPHLSSVAISNARTGQVMKELLSDPWHGLRVQSTAVDHSGQIWVSLAKGPTCTSGIASCGPKPNSCASAVVTIDPATGLPHQVFTGSPAELITGAQPSPDGALLAYLDGTCERAFFNQHLRVRNLKTGQTWDIGSGLEPCHALGSINWTLDGKSLVVSYGASRVTGTPNPSLGVGNCASNATKQLAVVPALATASGLPGSLVTAQPRCEIEAAAATKTGYAAIEACVGTAAGGSSDFLAGPARLITFDNSLHVTGRTSIGRCVNGAELRTDPTGTELLGTTYQYCTQGGKDEPKTVTFTDTAAGLKTIVDQPNGGSDTVRAISW